MLLLLLLFLMKYSSWNLCIGGGPMDDEAQYDDENDEDGDDLTILKAEARAVCEAAFAEVLKLQLRWNATWTFHFAMRLSNRPQVCRAGRVAEFYEAMRMGDHTAVNPELA
jgi:hypothetical protein